MAKAKTTYRKVITDFGTGRIENNDDNTFVITIIDTSNVVHIITIDDKYLEDLRDAAAVSVDALAAGYDKVDTPY